MNNPSLGFSGFYRFREAVAGQMQATMDIFRVRQDKGEQKVLTDARH